MSSNSPHCRVMVIEGAKYTGRVVARHVSAVNEAGKYRFGGMGFRDPGLSRPVGDRKAFELFHYFPEVAGVPRTPAQALRVAAEFAFSAAPPPPLSTEPAALRHSVGRRLYWNRTIRWAKPLLCGYDLYHWHCFVPDNLPLLRCLPQGAKLIITLWGSDLYRTSGLEEYSRQLAACSRACAFTMGSLEMRDTFLAKFGWNLKNKVHLVTYGTDQLKLIAEARKCREQFRRAHDIPSETITIAVGHNGNPANQHVAAIEQLATLPGELRGKIIVLVPLTYDLAPGYACELRRIANAAGLQCHVFERFLSDQETAQLRAASDITIHVPITDQFSAAMCEALAAGSILITGAWLPYSRLRLNGVSYLEVGDVSEVGCKLQYVLRNFEAEKAKTVGAAGVMHRLMDWTSLQPRWLEIYDEVLRQQ